RAVNVWPWPGVGADSGATSPNRVDSPTWAPPRNTLVPVVSSANDVLPPPVDHVPLRLGTSSSRSRASLRGEPRMPAVPGMPLWLRIYAVTPPIRSGRAAGVLSAVRVTPPAGVDEEPKVVGRFCAATSISTLW